MIYSSIIVLKNNNLRQYNVYGIYDVIIYILVIYINLINWRTCYTHTHIYIYIYIDLRNTFWDSHKINDDNFDSGEFY